MRSKGSSTYPRLEQHEWNFDEHQLSNHQLRACFFYEFCREFAKTSKVWEKLTMQLARLQQLPKGDLLKKRNLYRDILALFPRIPGNWLFLGPQLVETPWARIPNAHKSEIVAEWENQSKQPETFNEADALNITFLRDLFEWKEAGVQNFHDWMRLDSSLHRQEQREYGFVAIGLNYTDGLIISQFMEALKRIRGHRAAVKSKRGQNKMRQHLKALGAKRLLDSGLSAPEASEYSAGFLKDEQGNSIPLYEDPRSWSIAKNHTVPAVLERIIPGYSMRQK